MGNVRVAGRCPAIAQINIYLLSRLLYRHILYIRMFYLNRTNVHTYIRTYARIHTLGYTIHVHIYSRIYHASIRAAIRQRQFSASVVYIFVSSSFQYLYLQQWWSLQFFAPCACLSDVPTYVCTYLSVCVYTFDMFFLTFFNRFELFAGFFWLAIIVNDGPDKVA